MTTLNRILPKRMTFSILFWNIWLDNQLNGAARSNTLLKELERLTVQYQPDFLGLNEVLQSAQSNSPFVLEFLKDTCGYAYSHFASASPLTEDWLIGSALCSRIPFNSVQDVAISEDTPAKRRGHHGHHVKAIVANVTMPGSRSLQLVVAHAMHLRSYTLHDHYAGTASLEKLIRSSNYAKNTILGGDFNEPGFMPKSFKHSVSDVMHMRTGSRSRPTWRHNAQRLTPIRANLDQLYWTKNSEFTLKRFEIVDSNVSDHRPLFATFEY